MLHKKLPNCYFGNIFDISTHVKIPIIAYPHTLKYLSKHNFDISAHVKVPIMTYPHVLKTAYQTYPHMACIPSHFS